MVDTHLYSCSSDFIATLDSCLTAAPLYCPYTSSPPHKSPVPLYSLIPLSHG